MIDDEDITVPRPATDSGSETVPRPAIDSEAVSELETVLEPEAASELETVPRPAETVLRPAIDSEAVSRPAETVSRPAIDLESETALASEAVSEPETDPSATIQVPVTQPKAATLSPQLPSMNIEDLLTLKVVSDPQIAPDGSSIAFTVQQCNSEQNTTESSIWLLSSVGGKSHPPRQLNSGGYHDTMPRWSPDGQTLAFLSDRTGTTQIFLLPMYGGEARQLSMLPNGVTAYSWRPGDGQILLAHSSWKPADDIQPQDSREESIVYTRLNERKDGSGARQERYQQLWLVPLEGKALRITSEPVDLTQSCWSPDGSEIVFCANRRPDPDLSTSSALWVLTLASGHMRRLTPEEGFAQMPAWSPDGQSIAYLYTTDLAKSSNIAPWLVSAQGDTAPALVVKGAEKFNCQTWIIDELRQEWLAPPLWYPDSKALLVPVQERGQVHLYCLDLEQDTSTRLTNGNGRYVSPQISKRGELITLVRADWFTPGDIWIMDRQGQKLSKLTRINDVVLQSHQLVRPRRIKWSSFDGQEIEGWLYLPTLPEQTRAPLILAVHGGPSLAWGDGYVHAFQVLAGRGYAVLAANPRGSTGYGEEFSQQVLNDWGGDDFLDLLAGIDHVNASEAIDEQRLGVEGMSYGGYMTNWAITQTDRFKAAVSRNGMCDLSSVSLLSDHSSWYTLSMNDETLQQQRSALPLADDIKTPLLLLHAEDDLNCPFSESLQLFTRLRKRKHAVELVCYHHASHLMDWPTVGTPQQRIDRLRRTLAWFERYV